MSVVGAGMKSHPGVAAKTFATLHEQGIVPAVVTTSPIKIACHIPTDDVEKAVARSTRRSTCLRASASSERRARWRRPARAAESDWDDVRYFASARSAGTELDGRRIEEATPGGARRREASTSASSPSARRRRWSSSPHAVRGGAVAIDKSSAWRMEPDVPLVVPEVNGDARVEHNGVIAVPNCSTIQLVCALKPLHDAAGLRRVRVATYQSVSGAGKQSMERLRGRAVEDHDLRGDWTFEGEEFEEEAKIREETRKILELPELPVQATCVRVPVLVGHLEAVWIETERRSGPEQARKLLAGCAGRARRRRVPEPGAGRGHRRVLVGRDAQRPRDVETASR